MLAPACRRRGGSVAAPGGVPVLWRQGVRATGTRGVVAGCRGRLSFSALGLAPSWHLAYARRGPASLRPGVGAVAAHAAPHPATSSCCFWRPGPRIALRYSWRPTTLRGSVSRPPVGLRGGWEAAGPNFLSALSWISTLQNGPRLRPPLTPRLRSSPIPRLRPLLRLRPTPNPPTLPNPYTTPYLRSIARLWTCVGKQREPAEVCLRRAPESSFSPPSSAGSPPYHRFSVERAVTASVK